MEDLDNSWIKEFKETELNYNQFYKEQPTSVKFFYIYINSSNDIESIKTENYALTNAIISKNNLIYKIKTQQQIGEKKYKLISLLKFNITIEPKDIVQFINTPTTNNEEYLTHEKNLNDIKFQDTIRILQDINALYFILHESEKKNRDTKRIIFKKKLRKTKRKRA